MHAQALRVELELFVNFLGAELLPLLLHLPPLLSLFVQRLFHGPGGVGYLLRQAVQGAHDIRGDFLCLLVVIKHAGEHQCNHAAQKRQCVVRAPVQVWAEVLGAGWGGLWGVGGLKQRAHTNNMEAVVKGETLSGEKTPWNPLPEPSWEKLPWVPTWIPMRIATVNRVIGITVHSTLLLVKAGPNMKSSQDHKPSKDK
jgi:hypothetical protein